MNNQEMTIALSYIANQWPGDMHPDMVQTFGVELLHLDFARLMDVLRDRLINGGAFRPSLADILRPFKSGELEQASRDFQKVLEATRRYPPGMRDGYLSPRAAETVRRMGGWSVIGQWQQDARHHQLREFSKVWDDVSEADTAKRRGAMASGASPVVASLAGAKSTPAPTPKPSPRKVTDSGLTAEFRKMLKGGE